MSVLLEGNVAREQVGSFLGVVEVEVRGWRRRWGWWPAGPVLGVEHGWDGGAEAVEQAQVLGLGVAERDEPVLCGRRDLDVPGERGHAVVQHEQQIDAWGGD